MILDEEVYLGHGVGGTSMMMPGAKSCPAVPGILKRDGNAKFVVIKPKKQTTLGSKNIKGILKKNGSKKFSKAA